MQELLRKYWYPVEAAYRCRRSAPAEYCAYVARVKAAPKRALIEATRFVVFDSESTGLDPTKDRIISIGAVAVQGSNLLDISDSYESDVFQDFLRGKESIEIHGIRKRELTAARSEAEVIAEFLDYLGDSVLVAHHAWFDTRILHHTMRRIWGVPLLSPSLDTLHLARRFEDRSSPQDGDYTLDALARHYQVRILHRHKAAGDALVTAELLIKLLQRAKKRGLTHLHQLFGKPSL